MARPQPRNILVCFDAFGTLIWPRRPVPQQYGEVARRLGLGGFSDRDIEASFKKAFAQMIKAHPNYGHQSNMGAETWWTNVGHAPDPAAPLRSYRLLTDGLRGS